MSAEVHAEGQVTGYTGYTSPGLPRVLNQAGPGKKAASR